MRQTLQKVGMNKDKSISLFNGFCPWGICCQEFTNRNEVKNQPSAIYRLRETNYNLFVCSVSDKLHFYNFAKGPPPFSLGISTLYQKKKLFLHDSLCLIPFCGTQSHFKTSLVTLFPLADSGLNKFLLDTRAYLILLID